MRTTTLVLIVAGVTLLAVALWLSTVMPIRNRDVNTKTDTIEATYTMHLTLWGTLVRKSSVLFYRSKDGVTVEMHEEGGAKGVNNHGPWSHRERFNGGEWTSRTYWCIDGKVVTEEEWNTYLRGR